MDNTIYITASRQFALFRDMETVSNNLANVNTTGYKANHLQFAAYLANDSKDTMQYTHDVALYRDTSPGAMNATGNDLDVAIEGNGYLVVDTPNGPRYTRGGDLRIDGTGTLVNSSGYPVLDVGDQHIYFDQEARDIKIGALGNIVVNGEELTNMNVVQFNDDQNLERLGNGLYATQETPQPAEDYRVLQGVIESSNVQPVTELTHMMDVSRAVNSTAKLIEVMYDLERRTTTTWTQQG